MTEKFLHKRTLEEFGRREILNTEIPSYLTDHLNPAFELRPYQEEAFARFFLCFENNFPGEGEPLHFLFNRRRHCLEKTLSCISAMFNQLPCTGVWTNSNREQSQRALTGEDAL